MQADDFSRTVDVEDKFEQLEAYLISCTRHRIFSDELHAHKRTARTSVNTSMSSFGSTVSPLCAFYSTHPQQMLPSCKIQAIILRSMCSNYSKKNGTVSHYFRPNRDATVSIIAFSDARHTQKGSQLCFIIGLVNGNISKNIVLHLLD